MKNSEAGLLIAACLFCGAANAAEYYWQNLAGLSGGPGNMDGTLLRARFSEPRGVAIDAAGYIYICDRTYNVIRRISPEGDVTTFAGAPYTTGTADGIGNLARFNAPEALVASADGNIYLAEFEGNSIRRITPDGTVTRVAGSPEGVAGTADGLGTAAGFDHPRGIAVDGAGNLYVADTNSCTIRKITTDGLVTTLAGLAGQSGSANGIGSAARFNHPVGIAVRSDGGIVYVADTDNHTIRQIIVESGEVTKIAGAVGSPGNSEGLGSGPARFNAPMGLVLGDGVLWVADSNNKSIRKVSLESGFQVSTVPANLDRLISIAKYPGGSFIVPVSEMVATQGRIRKVTEAGGVTFFAGRASNAGLTNATGSAARFSAPDSVCVDSNGNVLVADFGNGAVRKITPEGVVTKYADAANAAGVALGSDGLYVSDLRNHVIRRIPSSGSPTVVAGLSPQSGSIDGAGAAARFSNPSGLVFQASGILLIADSANNTIRRMFIPGFDVRTFAGVAGTSGTADGFTIGPTDRALLSGPSGIAVAGDGSIYIADNQNHTIRKVVGSNVSTIGGSPGIAGHYDGGPGVSLFNLPASVACDPAGNLFVAEIRGVIRMITPAGIVSTIGGRPSIDGDADGVGPAALFCRPNGIAVGPNGLLYVADRDNNRIVVGQPITPLQAWRYEYFETILNSGDAADDADPDFDGICNLLEYALGGNPLGNDAGGSILPVIEKDGPDLYKLRMPQVPRRADLRLVVQASTDLDEWTEIAQSVSGQDFAVLHEDLTSEEVTSANPREVVIKGFAVSSEPSRFMRLVVSTQ